MAISHNTVHLRTETVMRIRQIQPATRAKEVSPVRERWEKEKNRVKPRRGGTVMLLIKQVHFLLSEQYCN